MTKEQVKKIAKVIVPLLLAIAGAYGYVDSNCTCEAPASAEPVDAGE